MFVPGKWLETKSESYYLIKAASQCLIQLPLSLSLSSWKAKYKSFVMSFPRLHTRYNGICSFHRRPAKHVQSFSDIKKPTKCIFSKSPFTKNEALVPNWREKKIWGCRTLALCNLSGEKEGGLLSDGQCHCLAPSGAAARHKANLWLVNDHPHLLYF